MCRLVQSIKNHRFLLLVFTFGAAFGFLLSTLLFILISGGSSGIPNLEPEFLPDYPRIQEDYFQIEDPIARQLTQRVRVLCWVMTNPSNHRTKARHVKATWGKRCNILLFMSSQADESLPTVALPVGEGRDNLWAKTKEAFKYVWANYRDQADWFFKADDDTYAVLENMRYMLAGQSPDAPVYYGCRFKPYVNQGYMSGGAGYVLSRRSLQKLVEEGLPDKRLCRQDGGGAEDVEMGICLEKIGVQAMDSRDQFDRGRFFPLMPGQHLVREKGDHDYWYWKSIYYNTTEGLNCCANSAISFHYVKPRDMYVLDYLIYQLIPYGMGYRFKNVDLWDGDKTSDVE